MQTKSPDKPGLMLLQSLQPSPGPWALVSRTAHCRELRFFSSTKVSVRVSHEWRIWRICWNSYLPLDRFGEPSAILTNQKTKVTCGSIDKE